MLNHPKFDELAANLSAMLAKSPIADIEKNARAFLKDGFSRLDLVPREEFEIQKELLLRARARIDELEARVVALEAQLRAGVADRH